MIDRSNWPRGPWDAEPEDRIEWRSKGVPVLPCLMVRSRLGAWCGYVGVPPGHPWHGVDYDDVRDADGDYVDAHGGLTYAAPCAEGSAICHVPRAGETDNVWWLGFDCAHAGDLTPTTLRFGPMIPGEVYRDKDYVRSEVESLARKAQQVCK